MKPEAPRFALVRWPNSYDPTVPACIYLDGVPSAVERGAILVAIEDEALCAPLVFNPPRIAGEDDPA